MAFEKDYALSIGSKNSGLTIRVIPEILSCPSLEQVIFPAKLELSAHKEVWFASPQEFKVEMIPKAFRKRNATYVWLDTENGLTLHIEFRKQIDLWSGHSFILEFNQTHVKQGTLSVAKLKGIISEVSSTFRSIDSIDVTSPRKYIGDGPSNVRPKVYHDVVLELDWFTYYSPADLSIIGRERFDNLRTCYEKYDFMGGIMIILQEEPFDERNPEHIARRLQAEKELGFDLLPDEPIAKG